MSTMKYIFYLMRTSSFSFVLAPIKNKLRVSGDHFWWSQIKPISGLVSRYNEPISC